MNIKRILCPVDFSPESASALALATIFARDTGAEIVLLHVVEPLPAYGDVMSFAPLEPDCAGPRSKLEAIAVDPALKVRRSVLVGFPADTILGQARSEHADLIVMGTHGHTGLTHLLMGSVAESIVRNAPCAVLTIKSARHAEHTTAASQFAREPA